MCKRNVLNAFFVFVGKVDVSLTDSVQQLISLFRSLCITFGKPYSDKKVRTDDKQKHLGASLQTNERVLYFASMADGYLHVVSKGINTSFYNLLFIC